MPMTISHLRSPRAKRVLRVRAKLSGSAHQPRVTVARSNRFISVQAIDDQAALTLALVSDKHWSQEKRAKLNKTARASLVGQELAAVLRKQKIKTVIFDRGAYRYHGRVKAVAEALRAEGIKV